ncbi:MAG: glycine--tRNA ligase subunit beta, partial [Desulfobulbaceae bacterium]
TVEAVMTFIQARFVNDCVTKGMDPQAVDAVVSVSFDDVIDILARIDAFTAIRAEEAFALLAAAYKRIGNIIKDNDETTIDASCFAAAAEEKLYAVFLQVHEQVQALLARREYHAALKALLDLKQPVDTFFDEVMVMADDPVQRRNRLNLLTAIGQLVLQIGDISRMQES